VLTQLLWWSTTFIRHVKSLLYFSAHNPNYDHHHHQWMEKSTGTCYCVTVLLNK